MKGAPVSFNAVFARESAFWLAWTKSRKSYCTSPGVGVSKMLKFYVKVFYVLGKALSGELSCPCYRSFLSSYLLH